MSTLVTFNNDVPKYLRFLQDNLKLISSTGAAENTHKDLNPHILLQLRSTTIPVFQHSVLKWQREYFENVLELTPLSLVLKADQAYLVLQQAGQWMETKDPSITALHALLQTTKAQSGNIIQTLTANFSQIAQRQRELIRSAKQPYRPSTSYHQTPDWLLSPPAHPDVTKYFNGRQWLGLHAY
jgi:hypothetical protein